MDAEIFVQNVKKYCDRRGIKPTVACRESGAGPNLINHLVSRGTIPSVEKVRLLASYLGVTTSELLGEVSKDVVLYATHEFPPVESMEDLLETVIHSGDFLSRGIQIHCENNALDFSGPLYVDVSAKVSCLCALPKKTEENEIPNPQTLADLTSDEMDMVAAYRTADERARGMVDLALEPWKRKESLDEVM